MTTVDRATSLGALRVAVIDTDRGFIQVLTNRLQSAGWSYEVLARGPDAGELISMRVDALVINVAALHNGWDYLEQLCVALDALAIVVCAGPSSVAERVRGLRLGADDWLNKPCHPEELIARVEAAVRRQRLASQPGSRDPVGAGDLTIRPDQFQAFVGGIGLDLTRREYELLHLLAELSPRVIPREEIYQRVWGYTMVRGDRSVDVFIRKLRLKLEKASPGWSYIHTHQGVGYRFSAEQLIDGGQREERRPASERREDEGLHGDR